jgi:hypothetical protein
MIAAAVFLGALFFFCLTSSGHIQTIDVDQSVSVSQQIVARKDVAVTGYMPIPGGGVVQGHDGRLYAAHDIGMAVVFIPISAMLRWHLIGPGAGRLLYALVDPVFGAATILLFFLWQTRLVKDRLVAVMSAALLGLTTIVWPYAHVAFDALPTAFFILTAVYFLHRSTQRSTWSDALWAGCAGAAAMLLRIDSIIVIALASVWLLAACRSNRWEARLRMGAAWLSPLILAALITAWYDTVRFGGWLNGGHAHDPQTAAGTPVWRGLAGQLLSPGKGLFFFAPPVVLAVVGWWILLRRERALSLFTGITVLTYLGFHARLVNWSGAEAWGPRFIVPIFPLMMLSVGVVLARWKHQGLLGRSAIVLVCAAGLSVQVIGVATEDVAVDRLHGATLQETAWHSSQIVFGWRAIERSLHGQDPYPSTSAGGIIPPPVPKFDFWWAGGFPPATAHPIRTWTLVGFLCVGIIIAVTMGYLVVRRPKGVAPLHDKILILEDAVI